MKNTGTTKGDKGMNEAINPSMWDLDWASPTGLKYRAMDDAQLIKERIALKGILDGLLPKKERFQNQRRLAYVVSELQVRDIK